MGLEYIIEPEYGHPASEVLWDQRIDNSIIRVYYNGRELHPPLATDDVLLSLPYIKVTPVAMLPEEIRTPTGDITVEKDTPSNSLLRGVNPYIQIVYRIVAEAGHLTKEGIYKALVLSKRVLPDTRKAWYAITDEKDGLIKYLEKHATLTFYTEEGQKFYTKGRPLKSDSPHLISFNRGYDPVAFQIMEFLRAYSSATTEMIDEHIRKNLGWVHDPDSVHYYLIALGKGKLYGARVCPHPKDGNIKRIRENTWEYGYPLIPWGETSIDEKEKTDVKK